MVFILSAFLTAGCAESNARGSDSTDSTDSTDGEVTAEFKAFVKMKSGEPNSQKDKETTENGYTYSLKQGRLSITEASAADGAGASDDADASGDVSVTDEASASGKEIWASDKNWWVEDYRLGDVNGDGRTDILFSLWKSYSFGEASPARLTNDDASVKNHLFLYTVKGGRAKSLWNSSNLPRPIYDFELDPNGEKSPVSSGMLLRTKEGEYKKDHTGTPAKSKTYQWEGWGFTPKE
jgi:predicted lipoprotein with Yx(FWY)xxD motif